MLLLVFYAFIAGIVTILSPCILPVLPIVLSGSVGGGKQKPFGVISGFILSFTLFTLFLTAIVQATGISSDALRTVSIIIVALFGTTLFLPQFQVLTERLFSKVSGLLPVGKTGTGFTGGFLIGLSLGLVWTPCVGPILASVISLALTGSVNGAAFFITLAYAVGTSIPLLAITYGGRNLLQKVPWLLNRSGQVQAVFGVIMVLTAAGMFFNLDRKFQTYILTAFPQYGTGLTKIEENAAVQEQLKQINKAPQDTSSQGKTTADLLAEGATAPELIPGGEWFNTKPRTLKALRGKVVLIDFWTYTCINCIRTLPYLKDWHAKYADKGLVIIGVHAPEFEFEKKSTNVAKAIKDFNIQYPVMQDNNFSTWRAYNNHYWPAEYFIDKNGKIRKSHFGEGEYDQSEMFIQKLLAETGASVSNIPINETTYTIDAQTPESYLGYERIEYLSSPEQIQENRLYTYTVPDQQPLHTFSFGGMWTVGSEYAMPQASSKLVFRFMAKDVYLVMRPVKQGVSGKVKVYLDGKEEKTVVVTTDQLYQLIHLPQAGEHTLRLEFLDGNVEAYAFTFG